MSETVRAFIALPVSGVALGALTTAQESMRRLADRSGLAPRWVRIEQMHVTVKFIGQVAAEKLAEVSELVKWHAQKTLPIETHWSGIIAFGGPRRAGAVVAGIADDAGALAALAAAIDEDLVPLGIEREKRAFRAHVTLARLDVKANVAVLLEAGQLRPAEVGFDEIRLYESRLTSEGGVYSVLARAPLGVGR